MCVGHWLTAAQRIAERRVGLTYGVCADITIYYHPRNEGGTVFRSVCLYVCLSVCPSINAITHKPFEMPSRNFQNIYGRKGGQVLKWPYKGARVVIRHFRYSSHYFIQPVDAIAIRNQGRREGGQRRHVPPPGNSHAEENFMGFWLTHYCNGF